VYVENLTKVLATNPNAVLRVLRTAAQHRSTACTDLNAKSSRSHAVIRFDVIREGGGIVRRGSLTFVDLAGSERLSRIGRVGESTVKEARGINKSISALGNVIKSLSVGEAHVPYRDSKLTRILTGCLGGTASCVLVGNVQNDRKCVEETIMTLNFAEKCMMVKVKAIIRSSASVVVKKEKAVGNTIKIGEGGVGDDNKRLLVSGREKKKGDQRTASPRW